MAMYAHIERTLRSLTIAPSQIDEQLSNTRDFLDCEESLSNIRLPLRITGATFLHVLSIVGGDDILARLGVVHDGRGMWEKAIEAPVEEAGGNEGVKVANAETAQVEICQRGC